MASIILKDHTGTDQTYEASKIRLTTTDGTQVIFSEGESQEKTVDADFSAGDMVIVPDDGKLLTAVTIPKPKNLVPANIVKDVEIAGIVGTSEGGGGSIEFDEILRYFDCHIEPAAKTISLTKIKYDLIYKDTGSYDVTIPDTINGLPVLIQTV